jgi:hypothetical protein
MIVLFTLILAGLGTALYLRASDLEHLTNEGNREAVRECFRNANQRAEFRVLVLDPTLSAGVRDIVRSAIVNSPTVAECRALADQFHIAAEE